MKLNFTYKMKGECKMLKKLNWKEAYANWFEDAELPEIKKLNSEVDKQLEDWLPDEVFNEIYMKTAELEALNQEAGFEAGFRAGMVAALKAITNVSDDTIIKITPEEVAELVISVKEIGSPEAAFMVANFFIEKTEATA